MKYEHRSGRRASVSYSGITYRTKAPATGIHTSVSFHLAESVLGRWRCLRKCPSRRCPAISSISETRIVVRGIRLNRRRRGSQSGTKFTTTKNKLRSTICARFAEADEDLVSIFCLVTCSSRPPPLGYRTRFHRPESQ